jgi:hypothetical protein
MANLPSLGASILPEVASRTIPAFLIQGPVPLSANGGLEAMSMTSDGAGRVGELSIDADGEPGSGP